MNLKHLTYLTALEELGTLSAASQKLGITQPVLSRRLEELETELGLPLFYRSGKTWLPSEAGTIYLDAAHRILEMQSQTAHTLHQLSGSQTEQLCVGLTPHHGGRIIAAVYPQLIRNFPRLDLVINEAYSTDLYESLLSGKASILLNLYQPELMTGTEAAIFGASELLLVIPAYHPLAQRGSPVPEDAPRISPEDFASLSGLPFACYGPRTFSGWIIEQIFRHESLTPLTLFSSDNAATIQMMLQSGLYAGFILAMKSRRIRDMVYFLPPVSIPYYMTGCVFQKGHVLTEPERFLSYLHYRHMAEDVICTPCVNEPMRSILAEYEPDSPLLAASEPVQAQNALPAPPAKTLPKPVGST